jgi:hypothetical protein
MTVHAADTYLEAEVKCLHCSEIAGVIRQARGAERPSTVFHPESGAPAFVIKSLTELRCPRCQGSVYTDDFEMRYAYPRIDLIEDEDDEPRRGRPPKRLVELRRAREAEQARRSA